MKKITRKSVVVVDDCLQIQEKIIELINAVQYCSVNGVASNADDAIKLINANKPDFVILDIGMPGKSGFAVLQELQNLIPEICFIVFSNYYSPQYIKKCKELGAEYYLDKTKDFESLKAILEH